MYLDYAQVLGGNALVTAQRRPQNAKLQPFSLPAVVKFLHERQIGKQKITYKMKQIAGPRMLQKYAESCFIRFLP